MIATGGTAVAEARTAGDAPSSGHRADIQGLRAVAVILVVLYHASAPWLPGGYVGVDVFFVISGFVITGMLLRVHAQTDRIGLGTFYLRRSRRILPALALLTMIVMPLSLLLGPIAAQARTLGTGIAASLFSANIYLLTLGKGGYFDAPATTNPLVHTWSLSLEEQFYLVFPTLLALTVVVARRRGWRRPGFGPLVAVISAVSFVLCWAATSGRLPDPRLGQDFAFFAMPTRVWEFGIGSLLALGAHRLPRNRIVGEVCGWAGMALVVFAAMTFTEQTRFPGLAAVIPTVGAALVIAGASAAGTTIARGLSVRPLTTTGDLSYSWYLWHWPVIVFAVALFPTAGLPARYLAVVVSLLPALASYRWVERPIRFGPAAPGRTVPLALACIGLPVLLGLALVPVSHLAGRAGGAADYATQTRGHADSLRGCGAGRTELPDPACTWPVGDDPEPTAGSGRMGNLLLGDSNAGQLSEPFIAASHRQGRDATIETRSTCPFVDLRVSIDHAEDPACRRFVRSMLDEMKQSPPDQVVISTALDRYLSDPGITFTDDDGTTATTPAEKEAMWTKSFAAVLRQIDAAGVPTVVVLPIPKYLQWDPRGCATVRMIADPGSCGASDSTRAMHTRRVPAARAETAATRLGSGTILDPFDALCPGSTCSTYRAGTWWWRDNGHLTVHGAKSLTPLLTDALGRASGSPPG